MMPSQHRVVFLQRRPHPAGAQTCLLRLMKHPLVREFHPLLVGSAQGWLTQQCDVQTIDHLEISFPPSRTLLSRLLLNHQFAARLANGLGKIEIPRIIVHANDFQESLLALAVAKRLKAKAALFLRAGGMTEEDYQKHNCGKFDLIAAVGDELQKKAQTWETKKQIHKIYDGLYPEEILSAKKKSPQFPRKILVVGSPTTGKGWADLTAALCQLEQEGVLSEMELHFTGAKPVNANCDLRLERLKKVRAVFLGRVENFKELILQFDLAINPSRYESFGMAALEILAAGVPLLSSRTGVIEQVQPDQKYLFAPNDPVDLARSLKQLIQNWDATDFSIAQTQKNILARFNIDESAQQLTTCYQQLLKT